MACRSLGFPGARTAYSAAYFGSGSGPIWLDDTFCDGMPEYFLFICSRVVQNQLNEAAEECLVAGKGVSTILNEAVNMNNF